MAEEAGNINSRSILKARSIAILFLLIIIYPAIDQKFNLTERKKADRTKKVLNFPDLDTNKLDSLPKLLEDYYSDKFILQDTLVTLNSFFKIKFLGISPDPTKVIVGKDGWLFWAKYIENYRGTGTFTEDELIKLKEIMDRRGKWYREHGIRFYFAPAPDKTSIYPEYLPSWIQKVEPQTMLDQLNVLFEDDTLVPFIDMRKSIMEAKKDNLLLYDRIDHHWTEVGAFYGYLAIADRLHKDFPDIVPLKYEDYNLYTGDQLTVGSESEMINISKWYNEHRYRLIKKIPTKAYNGEKANYPVPGGFAYPESYEIVHVVDGSALPSAFVIRDSFADLIMQYFDENFRRCKYIYDYWNYNANKEFITKEKPEIVILMPYESNMKRIIECDHYDP